MFGSNKMSLQYLTTQHNEFQVTNFFPSQISLSNAFGAETNTQNPQFRLQILSLNVSDKTLSLNLGETEKEEEQQQGLLNKTSKNGQTKLCARGHWRPAEDAKLKELVSQYGPQNWNLIAENLQGRSGKSCRLRWFNQLDPRIIRRAFTEEEEERLLEAHKVHGTKWAVIARLFPGRTDNAVKNHWHVIMARKHREQSSVYRKRKPFSADNQINPPSKKIQLASITTTDQSSTVDNFSNYSTSTDLSLTLSSTKSSPFLFIKEMGLLAEKEGQNSDTTSEGITAGATDSESIGTNNINLNDNHNVAFFDFLGVGSS